MQENYSLVISFFFVSFAGFDAIALANNHLNDFGSRGANFTVQVLKEAGIKYFGVSYGKFDSSQVSKECFVILYISQKFYRVYFTAFENIKVL